MKKVSKPSDRELARALERVELVHKRFHDTSTKHPAPTSGDEHLVMTLLEHGSEYAWLTAGRVASHLMALRLKQGLSTRAAALGASMHANRKRYH